MKKNKLILLGVLSFIFICGLLSAQDNWISKTHLTGYISTAMEYQSYPSKSAKGTKTPKNFGWGLSDAGFLASFKPLEKVEFKTTAVYTP